MRFDEKVWQLLKKIPKGKVTTYKEIAHALHTKAYRAVGNALRRNKLPEEIPCFKVIKSDGIVGGYMGNNPKNIRKKKEKLRSEGIVINKDRIDLSKYLYRFKR